MNKASYALSRRTSRMIQHHIYKAINRQTRNNMVLWRCWSAGVNNIEGQMLEFDPDLDNIEICNE